jgi:hypothetical protein
MPQQRKVGTFEAKCWHFRNPNEMRSRLQEFVLVFPRSIALRD